VNREQSESPASGTEAATTPPAEHDLGQMRREYSSRGLLREDLLPDAIEQFDLWFSQACAEKVLEPNAMSLATAGAGGQPTLRTVLLKGFDRRGFVFFTNLESRKSRQIAQNPQVALLFPWLLLERQVTILGRAEKLSTGEVLKYFLTRPFGSQLAAWASPQSQVITSRSLLEMKLAEIKRKFSEGKIPLPSFWGGYRVAPESIEFWQGRANRLHDRFLYTRRPDGAWQIDRLAP